MRLPQALGLAVLVLFAPVGIFLPALVGSVFDIPASRFGITEQNFFMWVLVAQATALALVITLIAGRLKRQGAPWSRVGLRHVSVGRAALWVAGGMLFGLFSLVLLALVAGLLGATSSAPSEQETVTTFGPVWSQILITVVMAPLIEEILFRGIILQRLLETMSHPWWAIVVSALIFAVVHLDPVRIVLLLPIGLFLGVMYRRFDSIVPGIALHAAWNLLVVLVR